MDVKIKILNHKAKMPVRATELSAGADLYACCDEPVVLKPGQRALIPTGLAMAIPKGYGGFVFARSGLASKFGITMSNGVGVIDSDYTGEVKIAMINQSDTEFTINNGDRVAQLVIIPVELCSFSICEELTKTDRGEGGFGSTGY